MTINYPSPTTTGPIFMPSSCPPTPLSKRLTAVTGQNGAVTWNDYDAGDVDNDPAYYLWVGNDGSPTALDYITTTLPHELAESASDPGNNNGVRQINCSGSSCQIGDPGNCQNWCGYVRGVKAQAYWSILDGNGVLPTMYSLRRTLVGKSIGGKNPSPMPSLNAWITQQF